MRKASKEKLKHWFCIRDYKENFGIAPEYQITECNEDQNFRIYKKNPAKRKPQHLQKRKLNYLIYDQINQKIIVQFLGCRRTQSWWRW